MDQVATPEILSTLRKVRELLTPKEAWTKNALARCSEGFPINPFSTLAVCFCLDGAIMRACSGQNRTDTARVRVTDRRLRMFLKRAHRHRKIFEINDAKHTTRAHILKWVDTVIAYDAKLLGEN